MGSSKELKIGLALQALAMCCQHACKTIHWNVTRLDSQFEPDNSVPLGYAMSSCASYALFKDLLEGDIFALQEWTDEGIENRIERRIATQEIHSRRIHLARSDLSDIAFDFRWDEEALNIHLQ